VAPSIRLGLFGIEIGVNWSLIFVFAELATMIEHLGGTIDQRVLVFNKGELAGIISPADIARLLTIRQRQASPRQS